MLPSLAREAARRRPRVLPAVAAQIEVLEDRLVLSTLTGYQWSNPNVSVSLLPDGTPSEGYQSTLYAMLNAIAPTEVWQREFARALQTWANVSNLNFHFVADTGAASGTSGLAQGDSRFGDIRLGAHPLDGYVAYAYYPSSTSTLGGDITLNPSYTLGIGTHPDLYSVLLHEVGHAVGLGHSTAGTVMYAYITGVYSGLTADDIQGVQTIYGARRSDAYDAIASNDVLATATSLTVDSYGKLAVRADLTSLADIDHYALTAPADSDGTLTVSVDARGISLLAPRLSVFDASGNLIASTSAGSAYGSAATLSFSGLAAGQTYYVVADGAADDAFGMGAYLLDVRFGLTAAPEPEPTAPPADKYESNDSFTGASDLGRTNGVTVSGLTLHSSSDVDYFRFTAHKAGTFQVSASASSLVVTVYDAQQNVLGTGSGSVAVSLASGQQVFVRVHSASGATAAYDLVIGKLGGSGGSGGGKGAKGQLADGGLAGHGLEWWDGQSELEHDHDEHQEGFAPHYGHDLGRSVSTIVATARAGRTVEFSASDAGAVAAWPSWGRGGDAVSNDAALLTGLDELFASFGDDHGWFLIAGRRGVRHS